MLTFAISRANNRFLKNATSTPTMAPIIASNQSVKANVWFMSVRGPRRERWQAVPHTA